MRITSFEEEWGVLKASAATRPNSAGGKGGSGPAKGSADQAEATLPAGCAARAGSTALYITVSLSAPQQAEKKALADRDTAIRNRATAVREATTNLAKRYGCAA
ncbi:hypothetical protein [Streptomyces sp. NPDC004728]|uniref:hypothetical protein n=1 Tax=Streptomyces sp. NPDC004728 TaxID=3154289 RepID=UPI00339E8D17